MTAPVPAAIDPASLTQEDRDRIERENMIANGVNPVVAQDADEEIYVDFWGYTEDFRVELPGQERVKPENRFYLVCTKMNEGKRSEYQKVTNSKVTILKQNQNAELGVDPARDRWHLIRLSVTDWFMMQPDSKGSKRFHQIQFNNRVFEAWYKQADPHAIEKLEREIRDHNPWMLAEMTLSSVEEEIARLEGVKEDLTRIEIEKARFSEPS